MAKRGLIEGVKGPYLSPPQILSIGALFFRHMRATQRVLRTIS